MREARGKFPSQIIPDALIEGGSQSTGDRHVLVLDRAVEAQAKEEERP